LFSPSPSKTIDRDSTVFIQQI